MGCSTTKAVKSTAAKFEYGKQSCHEDPYRCVNKKTMPYAIYFFLLHPVCAC